MQDKEKIIKTQEIQNKLLCRIAELTQEAEEELKAINA